MLIRLYLSNVTYFVLFRYTFCLLSQLKRFIRTESKEDTKKYTYLFILITGKRKQLYNGRKELSKLSSYVKLYVFLRWLLRTDMFLDLVTVFIHS